LVRKCLPGLLLLLGAFTIFWYRFQILKRPTPQLEVFGVNANGSFLNDTYFNEKVWIPNFERFQNSLINLIVFVDPMVECPGNIYETEIWAELSHRVDPSVFRLHIFVPESTPPEMIESFSQTFVLSSDQIVYYKPREILALYSKQGLFKVCWSLEDGYLWCEHGSASPIDQQKTREKLEALTFPFQSLYEGRSRKNQLQPPGNR